MRSRAAIHMGLACAFAAGEAHAETRLYDLSVPPGEPVALEVRLEVENPGTLVVEADWTGSRVLAFRLDPPAGSGIPAVRRSGPSPQRIAAAVVEPGRAWTLSIHGLAGAESGAGTLRVELPEPPPDPREAPAPPPSPVARPAPSPAQKKEEERNASIARLPSEWATWAGAVQRFQTAEDDPAWIDACGWQATLALELERVWRAQLATGSLPSSAERAWLERLAKAVRSVTVLTDPRDTSIAGPPPAEPDVRRAWGQLRSERVRPIETELDTLLVDLRRYRASAPWMLPFASCLMATERYFEERGRLGAERASNRELAAAQWPRLQEAAGLLERLVAIEPPGANAAEPSAGAVATPVQPSVQDPLPLPLPQ